MNKLLLLLLLLLPTTAFSQAFSTSLSVPALSSGPTRSSGGTGVIEFDRRVLVQVGGPTSAEFYLYMNTVNGDIGVRYARPGEAGDPGLNINDDRFNFVLIRSSGQIQTYMTRRKNGELKHYVSTGNTEVFPVSFPPMGNAVLSRVGSADAYPTRGGLGSVSYRANSSAPTYYLHGNTQRETVTTQAFLGYSGIGYMKSNRGIHMVVRADLGGSTFRAYSWSDSATRLDPTPFELLEVTMNENLTASLDRQESKLRDRTFTGDCSMEEQELNRLKLADIEARRRTNRERNTTGNVYENEAVRRATSELMLPNLEIMDREMDVKICKANVRLNRTRSEDQRRDLQERIMCYRRTKLELNRLQMEWNAIDARYPNEAGRAYAEKTRTYGRLMSMSAACR